MSHAPSGADERAVGNVRAESRSPVLERLTVPESPYVPVTSRSGNELHVHAAILAHDIARELRMPAHAPERVRLRHIL